MKTSDRNEQMQINAGSMADIAFLLLIFFMITTTIVNDEGLSLLLPPYQPEQPVTEIHERNIFNILINSQNKLLVEGKPRPDVSGLKAKIKDFILNNGRDKNFSESPEKAIVSIKTNRGTSQDMFIKVMDQVKAAYYEIYAERAGITPEVYRGLSLNISAEKKLLEQGKKGIPMNISIAESSH